MKSVISLSVFLMLSMSSAFAAQPAQSGLMFQNDAVPVLYQSADALRVSADSLMTDAAELAGFTEYQKFQTMGVALEHRGVAVSADATAWYADSAQAMISDDGLDMGVVPPDNAV